MWPTCSDVNTKDFYHMLVKNRSLTRNGSCSKMFKSGPCETNLHSVLCNLFMYVSIMRVISVSCRDKMTKTSTRGFLLSISDHSCHLLIRYSMLERISWSPMTSPLRRSRLGCGGDIWSQVEEQERFRGPALPPWIDSKSRCR